MKKLLIALPVLALGIFLALSIQVQAGEPTITITAIYYNDSITRVSPPVAGAFGTLNHTNTSNQSPIVEFNMTDNDNETLPCNLTFNGTYYGDNNTAFNSSSGNLTNLTTNATLSDGVYNLTIECIDLQTTYFNYNTSNITINIDTTRPVITAFVPAYATQYPSGQTLVTVNVTTTEESECRYNQNQTTNFTSMTALTVTNVTLSRFNITTTDGNAYNYYFSCTDSVEQQTAELKLLTFSVLAGQSQGGVGGSGAKRIITTPEMRVDDLPSEPEEEPKKLTESPVFWVVVLVGGAYLLLKKKR